MATVLAAAWAGDAGNAALTPNPIVAANGTQVTETLSWTAPHGGPAPAIPGRRVRGRPRARPLPGPRRAWPQARDAATVLIQPAARAASRAATRQVGCGPR